MQSLRRRIGPSDVSDDVLRTNFSLVLHERSDSSTVRRAVAAMRRTRTRIARLRHPERPVTVLGDTSLPADLLITARVGAFLHLRTSLATHTSASAPPVLFIDDLADDLTEAPFFRAPASLALPTIGQTRVCVAALVMRAGGSDTQLHVAGHFSWPDQQEAVLETIEALIQAHADQWQPARQLWSAPAEVLLRNEIR